MVLIMKDIVKLIFYDLGSVLDVLLDGFIYLFNNFRSRCYYFFRFMKVVSKYVVEFGFVLVIGVLRSFLIIILYIVF